MFYCRSILSAFGRDNPPFGGCNQLFDSMCIFLSGCYLYLASLYALQDAVPPRGRKHPKNLSDYQIVIKCSLASLVSELIIPSWKRFCYCCDGWLTACIPGWIWPLWTVATGPLEHAISRTAPGSHWLVSWSRTDSWPHPRPLLSRINPYRAD